MFLGVLGASNVQHQLARSRLQGVDPATCRMDHM